MSNVREERKAARQTKTEDEAKENKRKTKERFSRRFLLSIFVSVRHN